MIHEQDILRIQTEAAAPRTVRGMLFGMLLSLPFWALAGFIIYKYTR